MKSCRKEYIKQWAKDNPEKVKTKYKRYYDKNTEKMKKKNSTYRERFPDKVYNHHLRHRYGITLEIYNEMVKIQDNKCAICFKEETNVGRGSDKIKKLSVDHCHKTGKIRKLLCDNCNKVVGLVKEDINIVENLLNYIKDFDNI